MHWLWLELLDESVHVPGRNEPPAPLSLHDTVPEGDDGDDGLVSVTVAVKVIGIPAIAVAGFGDTTVVVLRAPCAATSVMKEEGSVTYGLGTPASVTYNH